MATVDVFIGISFDINTRPASNKPMKARTAPNMVMSAGHQSQCLELQLKDQPINSINPIDPSFTPMGL